MRHFLPTVTATLMAASPALAVEQAGEQSTAIRPAPASRAVEVSTGIEYQKGKYGTAQKVEALSIPTNLRVSTGRVQFTATLPYLRIDSPGNVVGGGGGIFGLPIIVDPARPATRDRREGIGDLRLGAAYSVPSSSLGLTFTGQVKVPTASERKRLGTGKIDYMVGAELSKSFAGITPFASVAYTIPGDPQGYDLRDSISARAGLAAQIGERVRGHIFYGYAQSLSRLVPDEQQISTGINAGLSDRLSLGLYGSAGLSQGAPDVGAGVQVGLRLF
jgi:hypothetical protein